MNLERYASPKCTAAEVIEPGMQEATACQKKGRQQTLLGVVWGFIESTDVESALVRFCGGQ